MPDAILSHPAAPDTDFMKPFSQFAPAPAERGALRQAITAACRRPEEDCLPPLLAQATLPPEMKQNIAGLARHLAQGLRGRQVKHSAVEQLVQEYALSSAEGIALMCLAEALLRIPDNATRNALIRDKIAGGDWQAHLGRGKGLFVNAAGWGLLLTGRLAQAEAGESLGAKLTALLGRYGEPLIRKSVAAAINMMGAQFVRGETIEAALKAAAPLEARGFRYSYDMLGEAAMTAADAGRYYASYEQAIHAIGAAAKGQSLYESAGISIKLSALHPRYQRAQAERVRAELLPQVRKLALLAKNYNIGLNIDAEEADRLDISLDILAALLFDAGLKGWDGIGFVVQAYGRRCPFVLDYIIDAARRSGHRVMLRLVKGAYWDSEIKRAQTDGLSSYSVYTRKIFTDVAYIACARKLLAAPEAIFPQFATHNAQTLATIYYLAGGAADYTPDKYEFQCLHGMGEPLYSQVVGAGKLNRPARIYAPVGSYETLLAYLVRRLLENGANSSFVHRIADAAVSLEELIADPADIVRALPDLRQNDKIAAPAAIYLPQRQNSAGLDLSDEAVLAGLSADFAGLSERLYAAAPTIALPESESQAANAELAAASLLAAGNEAALEVRNPADRRDKIGAALYADAAQIEQSFAAAAQSAAAWAARPAAARAAILARAADLLQARQAELLALCCREAGKTIANGIAEVREAIDFLRYYGGDVCRAFTPAQKPLGTIICISPWNFPLAIFTGQAAAALAAGNAVLAKPAEETPLTAALAVALLHEAGVPRGVLQLIPGDGAVGAALVAHEQAAGVVFTGSTAAARSIQARLAERTGADGRPIPLIAETGGQNALIVDSSALAEQVAGDCLISAFDSAGQRCSALRILCLQEDIADRFTAMIKGAMAELSIGRPDLLRHDIGPVITAEAAANISRHIEAMRAKGFAVTQLPLPAGAAQGHFVTPAIIEIKAVSDVEREVFGPVLHILRYKRAELGQLIQAINQTGYGLTFGLHTRLNATIRFVSERVEAGNIYINRNIIGAIVGSQPFGGRGLSGTGPKAGGPLYTGRLAACAPQPDLPPAAAGEAGAAAAKAAAELPMGADENQVNARGAAQARLKALAEFARAKDCPAAAAYAEQCGRGSLLGLDRELPGPVGEENRYRLQPRGTVLAAPQSRQGLLLMLAACLATGNKIALQAEPALAEFAAGLPPAVKERLVFTASAAAALPLAYALAEGEGETLLALQRELAALSGPIVSLQALPPQGDNAAGGVAGAEQGDEAEFFALNLLLEEVSVSNNIVAVGGNAKLMNVG